MGIGALAAVGIGSSLLGTATSMYGQYQQGKASAAAAKAQAAIARKNASLAEKRAGEALETARHNADLVAQGAGQEVGASIASAAARGVEVNSGSAGDLVRDLENAGEADVVNALLEGDRRARDLEAQADDFRANAGLADSSAASAKSTAYTNMLSTGIQGAVGVASKWNALGSVTEGA